MIESPAEEADQLGTTLPAGIPERFWLGIDRVKDFLTGFSVRTKILGIVVGFTIVLGLGVTVQVRAVMSSVLLTELDNRGASVASDVAARATDPLLLNDPFTEYDVLFDTVANHPDAEYAYVVDDSGDVLVHTFGDAGFPIELLDQGPGSTAGGVTRRQFDAAGEHFHEFGAAILDGRLGVVRIGMSETRLDGVVKGITTQMLITTVFVALVGVAAASFLTWLLTRPILDLVDMTRKVGEGDLTSRSQYVANDEVGTLSGTVSDDFFVVPDGEDTATCPADSEFAPLVYVFADDGNAEIPVDSDGADGTRDPVASGLVTQDMDSVDMPYVYEIGFLSAGNYEVAFSCDDRDTFTPETGTPATVEVDTVTEVDIEPDDPPILN